MLIAKSSKTSLIKMKLPYNTKPTAIAVGFVLLLTNYKSARVGTNSFKLALLFKIKSYKHPFFFRNSFISEYSLAE